MEMEVDFRIELKDWDQIKEVMEQIKFQLDRAKARGDTLVIEILSPKSEYK